MEVKTPKYPRSQREDIICGRQKWFKKERMIVFLGKNSTNGLGKIKVFKDIIQEKFSEIEKRNKSHN